MEEVIKRRKSSLFSTKKMVQIAILSAIAYGLMFISVPLPLFPSFLKIDLSDIPAILGGLAFGPFAGFVVVFIKNFLQMITATTTGGVGEVANTIIGGAYVVVLCMVFKRRTSFKGLVMGFVIGTLVMIAVGMLMNYTVLLPFYGKIMGMEAIIGMGKAINPGVDSVGAFVLWFIGPFNLVKGIIVALVTLPLYKKMARVIRPR